MIDSKLIQQSVTSNGQSLDKLSHTGPVLLVFLRHFGCVFCREALKDISIKREEWESKEVNIVFVHMSDNKTANTYFEKFNLSNIPHISDPECNLYADFGLTKGSASQLFGLKNWVRGFEVAIKGKALPMLRQIGDGFQMPGVFLISEGEVKDSYIHRTAADVPDYENLINCCAA